MSDYLFRLLERHQKLDRLLRAELQRSNGDPFRILRLKTLEMAIRRRMRTASLRNMPAGA